MLVAMFDYIAQVHVYRENGLVILIRSCTHKLEKGFLTEHIHADNVRISKDDREGNGKGLNEYLEEKEEYLRMTDHKILAAWSLLRRDLCGLCKLHKGEVQ